MGPAQLSDCRVGVLALKLFRFITSADFGRRGAEILAARCGNDITSRVLGGVSEHALLSIGH